MVRSSVLDEDMRTGGGGAGGPDLAGVRVLVAEDEAIVAFDLEETPRSLGCSVRDAVSSGSGLLELVRRERPDVVLLDLVRKQASAPTTTRARRRAIARVAWVEEA